KSPPSTSVGGSMTSAHITACAIAMRALSSPYDSTTRRNIAGRCGTAAGRQGARAGSATRRPASRAAGDGERSTPSTTRRAPGAPDETVREQRDRRAAAVAPAPEVQAAERDAGEERHEHRREGVDRRAEHHRERARPRDLVEQRREADDGVHREQRRRGRALL